jgi:hypothetical protein
MARTRRLSSTTRAGWLGLGGCLAARATGSIAFSTGQGEGGGGMRGEGRHSGDADGSGLCAERADGLRAKSGLQKSRPEGYLCPFPIGRSARPFPHCNRHHLHPPPTATLRARQQLPVLRFPPRGASALSPGSRTARLCLASRPSHKDRERDRKLRGRPGRRERWRWSGVE